MRILLAGDYPDDPRLGSGKVYHKLAEELRALDHDVHVLLAPQMGARPAASRVRWAVGPVLAERAVARAFAEHGRFDVVDVASAEGMVLGLRRAAGGYRGTAIVSRSHGLEHLNYARMLGDHHAGIVPKPWTRRLWYPAARMSQVAGAARLADRLLVLNEGDRAFAVARGWKSPDRIAVIPHGVSARFIADVPAEDVPRGAGILFCGSWDAVKGTSYLVDAFTSLAAATDARWTVLGPGIPEHDVLAAFPEAVRGRVRVVPRVGEDAVMRAYREHDVLVMSSTYEGFGMVIVEAMSQRLPVVATAVGCAPALLGDGAGGVVVPPRDADALAAALARLLADEPLRRRMGMAAHERVRGMTWARTARETAALYAAALDERRGASRRSGSSSTAGSSR
ncbi:MAG TPA: glycosyltransferase family 4 protein [Longimicrobiaceae bacterium]|nr:glycosyltransferase family 4 protein [Longimicrobiaceae bacterium]